MLEENIAYIANYFWEMSLNNINNILSQGQIKNFNINDYYYLNVIYQMGTPNLGDVAEKLHLTKPSISAMVRRLMQNELVYKTQSKNDKRVFRLSLTMKGLKIIQGDNALYKNFAEELTKVLTPEQVSDITCLLTLIQNKISASEKE